MVLSIPQLDQPGKHQGVQVRLLALQFVQEFLDWSAS